MVILEFLAIFILFLGIVVVIAAAIYGCISAYEHIRYTPILNARKYLFEAQWKGTDLDGNRRFPVFIDHGKSRVISKRSFFDLVLDEVVDGRMYFSSPLDALHDQHRSSLLGCSLDEFLLDWSISDESESLLREYVTVEGPTFAKGKDVYRM